MTVIDLQPPRSLARFTEAPGVFACLAVPWGEPAADGHELEGTTYRRGDVHQPRDPARCSVNFDHDRTSYAGLIIGTVSDRTGLWAAIKWGNRAQCLLARGRVAVSAEVDDGELTGLALIANGLDGPAFASAMVVADGIPPLPEAPADPHDSGLKRVAREADANAGRVVWGPPMPVIGSTDSIAPVVNMGAHKAELAAQSITRIEEDAERDRARFAEAQAAHSEAIAEAEQDRLRAEMLASATPVPDWPHHMPEWQRWRAFTDQLEAQHREDERLRREQLRAERQADRERLIEAQQAAWHWRHPVDEPIREEATSWLRRLLHRRP